MNLPVWLETFSIARSTLALAAAWGGWVQLVVFGLLLLTAGGAEAPPPERHLYPATKCLVRGVVLLVLPIWLVPVGPEVRPGAVCLGALGLLGGALLLGVRRWVWVGLLDGMPAPTQGQALAVGVPLLLLGAWIG